METYNFHKKILLFVLVIFISLIFSLTLFSIASSRPFRIGKIPDKGKGFGCATCHISSRGGGPKNSFGSDYENIAIKAGEKYTADLGKKDSDGDGYTNDQEFEARTHPGDPDSKP
jgi:hypothetical protein